MIHGNEIRLYAPDTSPTLKNFPMKRYPMLDEDPEHCAGSIYSVLESLWKARAELAKLKRK